MDAALIEADARKARHDRGTSIKGGVARFKARDGRTVEMGVDSEWYELDGFNLTSLFYHWWSVVGEDEAAVEALIDTATVILDLEAEVEATREEYEELYRLRLATKDLPLGRLMSQLLAEDEPEHPWLVRGLVRRGGVTLIGGREKTAGKSTLTAYLAGKLERCEDTVFGEACETPVKTVWVTEEPDYSLKDKGRRFDLADVYVISQREWNRVPGGSPEERWRNRLAYCEQVAVQAGYEHVVIDPLTRLAEVRDEAGTELGERVEAASEMAQRAELGITLIHHHNKGGQGREGVNKMRGSTTLTAAVDTILLIDAAGTGRSRKLTALGRIEESTWTRTITLNADGNDYTADTDEDSADEWQGDLLILGTMGQADAEEFGKRVGSKSTGRRRLKKLWELGLCNLRKEGKRDIYARNKVEPGSDLQDKVTKLRAKGTDKGIPLGEAESFLRKSDELADAG
jgi:AAA domain-containing protein